MIKKIIPAIIFFALVNSSYGSWEEITSAIEGKSISSKSGDSTITKIPLMFNKQIDIDLKKAISLKWIFDTESGAICSLFNQNSLLKTYTLKTGTSKASAFLEPGKYRFKVSSNSAFRLFRWKKVKTELITPENGGLSEFIIRKEKKYPYFRINEKPTTTIKVNGPATVNIFFRGLITDDKYKQEYLVNIQENGNNFFKGKTKLKISKLTKLLSDTTAVVSEAYTADINIPKGNHKYVVSLKEGNGLIKFKKERATATIRDPKNVRKAFGTFKVR